MLCPAMWASPSHSVHSLPEGVKPCLAVSSGRLRGLLLCQAVLHVQTPQPGHFQRRLQPESTAKR